MSLTEIGGDALQRRTIHIIILNYRTSAHVRELLEALAPEPSERARLLILDNASGGQEPARLSQLASNRPDIRVLTSSENEGFGPGVNLAVRQANASSEDLLWILNPDTVATAPDMEALAKVLQADKLDVVSPVLLSGGPDAPWIWFAGGDVDLARGRNSHAEYGAPMATLPPMGIRRTRFITGAAPMMSKATWDALGGFREDLFMYWEDAEWSAKATDLGLRLGVDLGVRIWHEQGASSSAGAGSSRLFYYYANRNRIAAARDFRGRLGRTFGLGLFETMRAMTRPLRNEQVDRRGKLACALRGVRDGILGKKGRVPAPWLAYGNPTDPEI